MICNYTDFFPIAINLLSQQKVKYNLTYNHGVVSYIDYTLNYSNVPYILYL